MPTRSTVADRIKLAALICLCAILWTAGLYFFSLAWAKVALSAWRNTTGDLIALVIWQWWGISVLLFADAIVLTVYIWRMGRTWGQ